MIQRELAVNTAQPYKIIIGKDILSDCGKLIKQVCKPSKACLIIDENAEKYYGGEITASLENAGFCVCSFTLKSGEESKSLATAEQVYNCLIENSFTRSDILVAAGGGVTGDLTGFVAATYLRGISFVQIPTTLLAAVDSSVGGKTAVNIAAGKNLVGAFWQPRLVVCDVKTFDTLSDEIYADGIAEAVKYGAIFDSQLFEQMKNNDIRENII
ncbi:MAG TPA: 3-dehydroquinate synthase, partial [Ruminococcaceae bacterium]|nr:3-dehydroquinate synthase [Oscillospiraceae bacterium]